MLIRARCHWCKGTKKMNCGGKGQGFHRPHKRGRIDCPGCKGRGYQIAERLDIPLEYRRTLMPGRPVKS